MTQQQVDYQPIPLHVSCHNATYCAVGTFKNHHIAGMCSTNEQFPIHLCNWLLPQCLITLNLLWPSCMNPKLSANKQLNGTFNFNHTPLAPPGTRVIVHKKPSIQQTWVPHGVDDWYLSPALEHDRCYTIYITKSAHDFAT